MDHIEIEEEDDDIVELVESIKTEDKKTTKKRQKLTSEVWMHFEMLLVEKDGNKKCKCKHCGVVYVCNSSYGIDNMKQHIPNCVRRDTRDVRQLLISQSSSATLVNTSSKISPKKFRQLLVSCMVMHDLSFSSVEWDGLRVVFQYLRSELK